MICKNYSTLKYYQKYYEKTGQFSEEVTHFHNSLYIINLWYEMSALSKKYKDKVDFLYNIY